MSWLQVFVSRPSFRLAKDNGFRRVDNLCSIESLQRHTRLDADNRDSSMRTPLAQRPSLFLVLLGWDFVVSVKGILDAEASNKASQLR